jgi:hypothetical protein
VSSEDERARAAEILRRITAQAEVLRRHYEASGNPLFVWAAILLFASHGGQKPFALPLFVMRYLHRAASHLVDLAEGVDWSKAPPELTPPKGADHATIMKCAAATEKWKRQNSLNPSEAQNRALEALGFKQKTIKNPFTSFKKELLIQAEVEYFRDKIFEQALLRSAGRKSKSKRAVVEIMAGGDTRNKEAELKKGEASLGLGRLHERPFGRLDLLRLDRGRRRRREKQPP